MQLHHLTVPDKGGKRSANLKAIDKVLLEGFNDAFVLVASDLARYLSCVSLGDAMHCD
jgi:hypothetical protein